MHPSIAHRLRNRWPRQRPLVGVAEPAPAPPDPANDEHAPTAPSAPSAALAPLTDGSNVDDLQHADASRDAAYEELLLLEKHIKEAPCFRCMNKHAKTARALLSEASGLKGGRPQDATVLAAHVEHARRELPTDPRAALTEIQAVRLVLGELLGYHGARGARGTGPKVAGKA